MAAFPLPAAILDDLILGSANEVIQDGRRKRKGRHLAPHSSIGVEKAAPGLGWRHFRRRHLWSKMAAPQVTSGGRQDAREDVLQTSAPSMSHAVP